MIPNASINSVSSLGLGDDPKPKTIAAKMEAMFMEVMLKTMEESVEAEGGLFGDSAGSEIYRGLFREQLASVMSSQLQSPLTKQLEQKLESRPTTESPASEPIESPEAANQDPGPVLGAPPALPALPVKGAI